MTLNRGALLLVRLQNMDKQFGPVYDKITTCMFPLLSKLALSSVQAGDVTSAGIKEVLFARGNVRVGVIPGLLPSKTALSTVDLCMSLLNRRPGSHNL